MTVRTLLKNWAAHYLSDEEAVILLIVLALGFAVVILLGGTLAPFLTALVLAFMLQGLVNMLTRRKVPQWLAVSLVYLGFVGAMLAMAFLLLPLACRIPRYWRSSSAFPC